MPKNDDLFAGLEVNGKIIEGSPTTSITPKLDIVDNSDLFEGLEVGGNVIAQVTPETGERGLLDVVTGSERIEARPELGELPEFGTTQEGDTPLIAAGFLSTFDPKAQMDIIKESIPEAKFETTTDGSTIIEVPTETGEVRRSVLNRPGLSPQDLMTGVAQVLSFVPAARLANLGRNLAAKIGIGATASGATEAGLQEAGVSLGREERDPSSVALAAGLGGAAEAVVPAIQSVRGASQARQIGAAQDELGQVAESVATAREAAEQTGVPLFQAQQTTLPTQLERQAFVAQLPSGTQTAVRSLKSQNKAAGDAVETFIEGIAPPEAVVRGADRVRTASRAAIENAKRIRAEKASPIYREAFEQGADVNISPVREFIEAEIDELPAGGQIEKSLKKVGSLLKGKNDAPPTLKQLHNAKLEIDQMLNKFGEGSLGNTTKAKLTEAKNILVDQMDEASESYRLAREVFEQESPAVNSIQESIVGKIADLGDDQLKQVSGKIFDAQQTNPKVILDAKKSIKDISPDAWNDIVRVELEKRIGAIRPSEAGTTENIPGQLFRALFPNSKSERVLMNALDAEGKKNLQFLKTALGRARLGRGTGSQTAAREEIKRELRGGFTAGIRDLISKPITTLTGAGAENAFNRRVSSMAKSLYDPTWAAEMSKIRKLNPDSPASARAFAQLIDDIEATEGDQE